MSASDDKVSILLVDDRWENIVSLKAVLDSPRYNLVGASSGREALKALLHTEFALILLDVQMPILNGFETAALIKKREKTKGVPIIFVTGMSIDEPFVYKGYETGAVDYIIKPFDPNILRSKVAVFADLYEATRKVERQAELLREVERKKHELEILRRDQEANQRYRDLVHGITHGIVWTADPQSFKITYMSPQSERILGRSLSQGSLSELNGPGADPSKDNFLQAVREVTRTRAETSIEHMVSGQDGHAIWLQTGLRMAGGGDEPWELRGLSVDITHLKETEQALQASEEQLRFLANASRAVAESLDYEKTLRLIAGSALPMLADHCFFDVLFEDGGMKRVAWAHVDPGMEALCEEACSHLPAKFHGEHPVAQVLASRKPLMWPNVDEAFTKKSVLNSYHGELLQRLATCSLITVPLLARERVIGTLSFAYSNRNSGRHHNESDLELALELAHRAGLALDNARLYNEAQKAILLRDEFLSIASHELKTPLTPLKLQLQALKRMVDKLILSPEAETRLVRIIDTSDRQISRINKLVDELLDVSRINNGKLTLEPENVELADLVREVVARFSDESRKVACQLNVHVVQSVTGFWDRLRIEQILTNLLTNALRYAPGKPIDVVVSSRNGMAVLEVQDNGPGISSDDHDRIFERFERAVPMAHFGGLGLGLYIVRQILEAHHGKVCVESVPGKGAKFIVELPISESPVMFLSGAS